jgi:hypothetical protein
MGRGSWLSILTIALYVSFAPADKKQAYQQTVEDFKQTSHIKEALQKRLILQAFTDKFTKTHEG